MKKRVLCIQAVVFACIMIFTGCSGNNIIPGVTSKNKTPEILNPLLSLGSGELIMNDLKNENDSQLDNDGSSSNKNNSSKNPNSSNPSGNSDTNVDNRPDPPVYTKTETVSIKNYTGYADDNEMISEAINDVGMKVSVAKMRGESVKYILKLEKKVYKLSSTLKIEGISDVEIDGAGGSFVWSSLVTGINFTNCKDVTFSNLDLDYDPLPYTQGTIKSVTPVGSNQNIVVTIDEGYNYSADFLNSRAASTEKVINSNIIDPVTNGPLEGSSHSYMFKNAANVGGRDVSLVQEYGNEHAGHRKMQPDDRISLYFRGPAAISTSNCLGLGFINFNIYASPGSGIHEGSGGGGTLFKNFKIVPGPKPAGATKDRAVSVGSDAMHFANPQIGPTLENCRVTHCGDDCINVQGFFFHVLLVRGNTVTVSPKWDTPIEAGETVEGYDDPDYKALGTSKVTGFVRNPNATQYRTMILDAYKRYDTAMYSDTLVYEITLDKPIPGLKAGDHLTSLDRVGSGAVIKNSFFGYNRARGVVLKGRNIVIENNTFEGSTHPAIVTHADLLWCESGFVQNVTIKNNKISGNSISSNLLSDSNVDQIGDILVNIAPGYTDVRGVLTTGFLNSMEHKNILIEGNTISNTRVYGIFVSNSNGVTIKNNTITNPFKSGFGQVGKLFEIPTPTGGIFVGMSNNVTVTGNTVNAQSAAAKGFADVAQFIKCTGTVTNSNNKLNK